MESVKINRNSIIYEFNEIKTKLIREEGGRLLIVFKDKVYPKIVVGVELCFYRDIYSDGGNRKDLVNKVSVLETLEYEIGGVKYEAVYTTIPSYGHFSLPESCNGINIKATSADCTTVGDGYVPSDGGHLVVKTDGGHTIEKAIDYHNDATPFFIIEFSEEHNITQQDIEILAISGAGDFSMTVLDVYGEKIGEIGGISIPLEYSPKTIDSADTLTYEDEETCGKEKDYRIYKYTYQRNVFGLKRIKFTTATVPHLPNFKAAAEYLLSKGEYFVPRYNRVYFFKMENLSEKNCTLWTDPWWPRYSKLNRNRSTAMTVYENSGGQSRSYFGEYAAYWNVPSLYISSENTSLGAEDEIESSYVNDIIERAVPDVVDMERLKYKPVIFDESGNCSFVKDIILDFHFLKRKMKPDAYFQYEDGWYIDEDDFESTWWNGVGNEMNNGFTSNAMKQFIKNYGSKSDLLGYLGFTDDDVRFRKSKLTKSFIRLSFYSSPDPVEQKLLYYSTIFLDGTSLYGKYIKQSTLKTEITRNGTNITPIVFYDVNTLSARVDTEIVLRDEYNTEHSSEGFNLYLFADDAMGVNSARTIYMKVEFNHAGNGNVIPMILWPAEEDKDEEEPVYQSGVVSRSAGFANVLEETESTLLVQENNVTPRAIVPEICRVIPYENLKAGIFGAGSINTDLITCTANATGCTANTCSTDGCPTDTSSAVCFITEEGISKDSGQVCYRVNTIIPCICKNIDDGTDAYQPVTATTFCGYVYDAYNGTPISDVTVFVTKKTKIFCPFDDSDSDAVHTTTNSDGYYSISVPNTIYNSAKVKFIKPGYTAKEFNDIGNVTSPTYLRPSEYICPNGDVCGEDSETGDEEESGDTITPKAMKYLPLKTDNYLQNLYIPIDVRYLNESDFVYSISGATVEGSTLRLILFEPKLENEKQTDD